MELYHSNDPEDRKLIKIEVGGVKGNMELEMIPKAPSLCVVWAS